MEVLTTKLDGVAALFGTGEVGQAADAAVGALSRRLDGRRVFGEPVRDPRAMRTEERMLFRKFRTLASQALQTAGNDVGPAVVKRTESP